MHGRDWGGLSLTAIQPLVKQRCACNSPPSLPTAAPLFSLMLILHAGQQYQLGLSCHHPVDGNHPSPLPSALPTPGIDLVWRWGVLRNWLDHTLCLMLIGLARPEKVSATVKLCLCGGDCEAKCLRSFSLIAFLSVLPPNFLTKLSL